MNYIETITIMLLIIFFIIVVIYIYTKSTTKIFNKEIWPIKKEERLNKLIVYEATDKYKDRTLLDPYSITHISHGILLYYIMNIIIDICRHFYLKPLYLLKITNRCVNYFFNRTVSVIYNSCNIAII